MQCAKAVVFHYLGVPYYILWSFRPTEIVCGKDWHRTQGLEDGENGKKKNWEMARWPKKWGNIFYVLLFTPLLLLLDSPSTVKLLYWQWINPLWMVLYSLPKQLDMLWPLLRCQQNDSLRDCVCSDIFVYLDYFPRYFSGLSTYNHEDKFFDFYLWKFDEYTFFSDGEMDFKQKEKKKWVLQLMGHNFLFLMRSFCDLLLHSPCRRIYNRLLSLQYWSYNRHLQSSSCRVGISLY